MTTARDICIDAIKESGALGVGQTPLAEEINDIFTRLQRMVALWNTKRWFVPSLQRISFIADGSISYTVGLGGFVNIKRPNDIKAGYVVQLNTGSTPVSLPLTKIFSYEDYIRIAVKQLPSLPDHFFYDAQYPLANLYPWPIPNSQYRLEFLIQSILGFGTSIISGVILTGGALYTDGIYPNVSLTGGSGIGAAADITITGGIISIVTLNAGGQDYVIGDILSVNSGDVGGTGNGFTWKVANIGSNLDSKIIMPEEYEEALMYNLALRACSYYQVAPMETTSRLAKAGINTIKINNTQVPTLQMPAAPGVRTSKAFNIYNPDNY
jgi:hypothetical protein